MAAVRSDRKAVIRDFVRSRDIRTQAELVALLKEQGFDVTQATVSRDMADLGLEKAKGIYKLPEDLEVSSLVRATVREVRRAGNQVVILTTPGAAQSMAFAIDASAPSDILGTLAGDDTVLVIAKDDKAGENFQQTIEKLIG